MRNIKVNCPICNKEVLYCKGHPKPRKQWETCFEIFWIDTRSPDEANRFANEQMLAKGEEGWEPFSHKENSINGTYYYTVFYKREKQ